MYEVNVAMAQLLLSAGHEAIRAMDLAARCWQQ